MTDTTEATDTGQCPVTGQSAGEQNIREFPLEPGWCPFDPPAAYAKLRAEEPISKVKLRGSGREAWLVTKHADFRQVLGDSRVSSNVTKPGYPMQMAIPDEVLEHLNLPVVSLDPPEHTARRRMLIPELTVKRMQALRPRIQEIVDEHVDAMLAKGGPLDLVQELSLPVPSLLFCELMGVPAEDKDFFQDYAVMLMKRDVDEGEVAAAQEEMQEYLGKLITERGENLGDEMLSRMIIKNNEDGELTHDDMVSLARMLLFGGFDTVANIISLGTVALLQNPGQLEQIKQDPSLTIKAVDELVRYLSISDSATCRVATEDLEVGGVQIRAGEGIIALNGSANRDEDVFENPDELDIHRDTKGHAAFGHGIHQCPGVGLARIELDIVFNTLFKRIPDLRLALPMEELPFKDDAVIYGIYELPVTW